MSKVSYNKLDDSYLDYFQPLQVEVTGRIEDAIHRFRAMVTRERIMSVLKEHASYEKPSDQKRRKHREQIARQRKLARAAKNGKTVKED